MATLNHSLLRVIAAAVVLTSTVGCSAESKRKNHLSRADDYFKAGEYEKAKIEYANVLQGDPQNGVAIRQMGLIWIEQGAYMGNELERHKSLWTPDDFRAVGFAIIQDGSLDPYGYRMIVAEYLRQ